METPGSKSVFIAWSKGRGKAIAELIKTALKVTAGIDAFVSSKDMEAGRAWFTEIQSQLNAASVGVLCLTSDSIDSPWVHFEAGALSRDVYGKRVIPVLFDIEMQKLSGPLASLECLDWKQSGLRGLLRQLRLSGVRIRRPLVVSSIDRRSKRLAEGIRRVLGRTRVSRSVEHVQDPLLRALGAILEEQTQRSLGALCAEPQFASEAEYLDKLLALVGGLGEGDSLRAICGHKNWALRDWARYLDLNETAGREHASVRRLYIQPASVDFNPHERRIIKRQLGVTNVLYPHFAAGVLVGRAAKRIRRRYDLLDEYGIVIIGRSPEVRPVGSVHTEKYLRPAPRRQYSVMIHHGLGRDRRGYYFEDRYVASAARKLFDEAWKGILRHRLACLRFGVPTTKGPHVRAGKGGRRAT